MKKYEKERDCIMSNRIDQLWCIILVMSACLILLASERSRPAGTGEPVAQTTEGSSETIETTAQTASESMEPAQDVRQRVERILDANSLEETNLSHCVFDPQLNAAEDTQGTGEGAGAYALAQLCGQRRMNPISAFWLLVSEGLYEKEPEESTVLTVPAAALKTGAVKCYADSTEGARELMADLLKVSGQIEDGLDLEDRLLGTEGKVEQGQVAYSEREDCYYAYFVCYGDRTAHFLCVYLRDDAAGESIVDVEFQLLNLCYLTGGETAVEQIRLRGIRQAGALAAAAELLLTGQSRTQEAAVSTGCMLGGYSAAVERFWFTSGNGGGDLTNYRIRPGK